MATRTIHKRQPLAKRSKTLRQLGSISSLRAKPRWKKYITFGAIAEEIGKKDAASRWRKKAYGSALDHGEYMYAETIAGLYLDTRAEHVARSLATLSETLSSGRVNGNVPGLITLAIMAGAPRELVAWELSSVRKSSPELTFFAWVNNRSLYSRIL